MAAENYSEKTEITAAAGPPNPHAGDVIGVYRLLKQLGTGGMGSVFLAEHTSIGRRVAMKFLLAELCQYPDIVGRFFDEARSVNRINHENIVEVFDFVREPSGLSYLVMELLEGTDLYQTRKRDGPYPLDRILVICEQVASALFAAHKVGIIHRDLKPENAFLIKKRGNKDFVKLLDFGLAKLSDELPVARMPTQAGIVMGTPGYMSPEQAHGAKVDGRSDVFSLGVLMHWMLCDKVPDGGPDSPPPEVSVRGDAIPEQLQDLIRSCIRMKPDERPRSMGEVAAVLTELRRQIRGTEVIQVVRSPSAARPPSRSMEPEVTFPQELRHGTEQMVAGALPSLTSPVIDEPPRAPETRTPRTPTKQLLLVGLGGAALALAVVGAVSLIVNAASSPPTRASDHAGEASAPSGTITPPPMDLSQPDDEARHKHKPPVAPPKKKPGAHTP